VKDSSPDWLISGALAGGAFLVSFALADIALPVSLAISALALAGGSLAFRRKDNASADAPDLAAALAEGRRKLGEIKAAGARIEAPKAKETVVAISATIEKILAEIKRDPDDLKRARQFLSYYLDATITILQKYLSLSAQNLPDEEIRASLARAESVLGTLDAAYSKQLAHLLTNDVMDLDAELSLLEKTIRMEGLTDQ
jgi:hypothetical protein